MRFHNLVNNFILQVPLGLLNPIGNEVFAEILKKLIFRGNLVLRNFLYECIIKVR